MNYVGSPWWRRLDDRALNWIRTSLANGHSLAHTVLDSVDFQLGTLTAICPANLKDEVLYSFDHSAGITASDADAGLDALLSEIACDGSLVVEDELARAGDGFLLRTPGEFSVYGDEVLWPFSLPQSSSARVIRLHSSGYPTNAFITGLSNVPVTKLDESTVVRMARATTVVICSVYDAESFVVWTAEAGRLSHHP